MQQPPFDRLTPNPFDTRLVSASNPPLADRGRSRLCNGPSTLQLYLDGKMEQFGLRDKEEGVIFLMSVDSVAEADRLLKGLPLGQANLLTFDLMPIGPLLPLGMLMKTH